MRRRSPALLLMAAVSLIACGPRQPAAPRQLPSPRVDTTTVTVTPTRALERSVPYPVLESPNFARGVERNTRTRTGQPGRNYWQQWSEYRIQATLNPTTRVLTGQQTVRYHNRSPDPLQAIRVHLRGNLFRPGAIRNEETPVTDGVQLTLVRGQGTALEARAGADNVAGYTVDGTVATVRLPRPILPGASAELEFGWTMTVPPDGAPRMGTDGETFFLAYWYPQIAVYDDVDGWVAEPYMGNAEFYMGYGSYDVSITVPAGWLIGATGTLTNASQVLSPTTQQRLQQARTTGEIVRVVTEQDRGPGRATAQGAQLTWRFTADTVRDFAFGASDRYLWDATIAISGDTAAGARRDTAMVHTLYRPDRVKWAWDQSARYGRHSVEFLSRLLWPYGYPQMTVVDGVDSCGGMEYPMITCIGGQRDTLSLYSVTVHEIAHMWFPMQVGSNEKRYSWQDEGLTRYNQAQAMRDFFRGYDLEEIARNSYLNLARRGQAAEHAGGEVELMRHGDRYPVGTPAFGTANYNKMGTIMVALRGLLGEETFMRAYREYGQSWINRHPQPWDFFNSFNRVAGRDLSWLWRTWFYETWTLDQAIAGVELAGDSLAITIEDRGLAPMPVTLAVTREDRSEQRIEIPVDVWLAGNRRYVHRVAGAPAVVRLTIDPDGHFPDTDRTNNVFPR